MTKHLYDRIQVLEREDELDRQQRLKAMARPLLSWYEGHARALPWRDDPTPYRVWISEIMLQQTRVEAVKPYFERFMAALPTVQALAAVEDDRLMKLWEGLGYYTRARNLKKAALMITERHGGELPGSYEALLALPGIGSYTAGAIASIAFGRPVPAVDGNVLRVVARITGDRGDIARPETKSRMRAALLSILPQSMPGDFNQALMELGATVCLPNGAPLCRRCPAHAFCAARIGERTGELPVKGGKAARRVEERTVFLIFFENRVALRRRPARGLLAKLWEYPNEPAPAPCPVEAAALADGPAGKHIFSHIEWRMRSVVVQAAGPELPPGWVWADGEALRAEYAVPNAFRSFAKAVEERLK